ncbi:hypothetical protein KK062_11060 [Fulvivirgaceae bacterium PWU5]|uniref:Outer membrane lipoprotein-sorting protein n=1 Tax=Dawidia cretensis TaxID=2782350 RepID=A0AAP2DYW5_9BACT|nr:hypothetical protein [Dawidia cretensis]MBT1708768.1 hypothetical protein [Dawidia cretensis]
MKKFLAIVFVTLLTVPIVGAQDLQAALSRLRQEYEQTDNFHIVMQVKVFDEVGAMKPYFSEQVNIRRSGLQYLYRFGNNEMLMNEKYIIMVDRGSKEIVCNKRSVKAERETFKDLAKLNVIDSVLRMYENPEYLGKTEAGHDHYRVKQKKGEIRDIDLFIDAQTHLLSALHYQYRSKQHVTITFSRFDVRPVFEESTFSENQYVIRRQGKMGASPAFKNYTVLAAN